MSNMTLHQFMQAQRELMNHMQVGIKLERLSAEILDASLGITEEAVEIVRELRNHMIPWRASKTAASSDSHAFHESVDVFFYLLELWALWGKTPEDIVVVYQHKWEANLERIKKAEEK